MNGTDSSIISSTDYTIACICPLGIELAPVRGMLDEIHESLSLGRDQNAYTLGKIGQHNVVVATLPEIGNNIAAVVATQLVNDFPAIHFAFVVGVGGGVPGEDGEDDIRLGDVVVSQPVGTSGGLVQYDLGKKLADGSFVQTGQLNKPPAILSAHVQTLRARHASEESRIPTYLEEMTRRFPKSRATFTYPAKEEDRLFLSSYEHQPGPTCKSCSLEHTTSREFREVLGPHIHYGIIGSANLVLKNATIRDQLRKNAHTLCIEMEAADIMSSFPCLVICGVCDYADSHKNKRWQHT